MPPMASSAPSRIRIATLVPLYRVRIAVGGFSGSGYGSMCPLTLDLVSVALRASCAGSRAALAAPAPALWPAAFARSAGGSSCAAGRCGTGRCGTTRPLASPPLFLVDSGALHHARCYVAGEERERASERECCEFRHDLIQPCVPSLVKSHGRGPAPASRAGPPGPRQRRRQPPRRR